MSSHLLQFVVYFYAFAEAFAGNGCFHPGKRLHSDIVSSVGHDAGVFPVKTNISYICDAGYEMLNNNSRQCLDNGTWTGTEPYCGIIVKTNGALSTMSERYGNNQRMDYVLDDHYATCTSNYEEFTINLHKTFTIDVIKLVFKVDEFKKDIVPNIRYCATDSQELRLDLIEHKSQNMQSSLWLQTFAVFMYSVVNPSPTNKIRIKINWINKQPPLCGIYLYSSSAPSVNLCNLHKSADVKYTLDDKCYAFYGDQYKSDWYKARNLCINLPAANSALANYNKKRFNDFFNSHPNEMRKGHYWIRTDPGKKFSSIYVQPNVNIHSSVSSSEKLYGRICEFDIPFCGYPDQKFASLMVINDGRAHYSCPEEFLLSGTSVRHCANGKWSHEAPTCKCKPCGLLKPELINRIISTTITVVAVLIIIQWLATGLVLLLFKFKKIN